jgi:hypothetical protein
MVSIKDCRTCEFLTEGICRNYEGIHGYGWKPEHTDRDKSCWSVSMDHFIELVTQLPEQEQNWLRTGENITIDDLIHRIHSGFWRSKVLKDNRQACQDIDLYRHTDLAAFL